MGVEIVTKEDLHSFRVQLMNDIKEMLSHAMQPKPESMHGYKTSDVRKILGCSVNKLVSLRISRKLRTKKVGGTLYYNRDDIKRLVDEGY
ncbi:MAG: helix-turn-helix domain-containing protein [Chitinophagaceae bacterium]